MFAWCDRIKFAYVNERARKKEKRARFAMEYPKKNLEKTPHISSLQIGPRKAKNTFFYACFFFTLRRQQRTKAKTL